MILGKKNYLIIYINVKYIVFIVIKLNKISINE